MGSAADWASVGVTFLLGIAGFAVARNINRDVRLKLAERRLAAYERLWAEFRLISPYEPAPIETTRKALHKRLTDWYYANGDGMLLLRGSREVYLNAKDNLIRPLAEIVPVVARKRLQALGPDEQDNQRGLLAQRQFSLLRTQLKSDLAMYGRPYGPSLNEEDRAFLADCGVDLRAEPWSSAGATNSTN